MGALDLLKRLPPSKVYTYLECLLELAPDIAEDLLANVDQPLQVAKDEASKAGTRGEHRRHGGGTGGEHEERPSAGVLWMVRAGHLEHQGRSLQQGGQTC